MSYTADRHRRRPRPRTVVRAQITATEHAAEYRAYRASVSK